MSMLLRVLGLVIAAAVVLPGSASPTVKRDHRLAEWQAMADATAKAYGR